MEGKEEEGQCGVGMLQRSRTGGGEVCVGKD